MSSKYQSVNVDETTEDGGNTPNAKMAVLINDLKIIGTVLIVVLVLASFFTGYDEHSESLEPKLPSWPTYLESQAALNTKRPTNTTEADHMGWRQSDEPCNPNLGQSWFYHGRRDIDTSVTLYFTPRDGDIPGSLSGIEVDYYGVIEYNLVGTYFTQERKSKDGYFHSVAIALRNGAKADLCSEETTRTTVAMEKYVAIAPDFVNEEIPMSTSSPALEEKWMEGSCIPTMGYHYFQDTVGGKDFSYDAKYIVPVLPMYDSNGDFASLFFFATSPKQNWADGCTFTSPECMGKLNYWDPGPGLNELNEGRVYMCANFCGDCELTGSLSDPGRYTTMHWFFQDPKTITCDGSDKGPLPYCPSGLYPAYSG